MSGSAQVAQDYSLPIRQRTNLWLEIFGNTLVQVRPVIGPRLGLPAGSLWFAGWSRAIVQ